MRSKEEQGRRKEKINSLFFFRAPSSSIEEKTKKRNKAKKKKNMLSRLGFALRETGQALDRLGCRLRGSEVYLEESASHLVTEERKGGLIPGARCRRLARASERMLPLPSPSSLFFSPPVQLAFPLPLPPPLEAHWCPLRSRIKIKPPQKLRRQFTATAPFSPSPLRCPRRPRPHSSLRRRRWRATSAWGTGPACGLGLSSEVRRWGV